MLTSVGFSDVEGMHTSCINLDVVTPECISSRAELINVWNSWPDSVIFESLQAFKRTVINVDLTKFLKCF